MKKLLILILQITAGQEFTPVPENLKSRYRFNFEKNYSKDTTTLHIDMDDLGSNKFGGKGLPKLRDLANGKRLNEFNIRT